MRIIHKYDPQLPADFSFKISCFQLTIILHPLYYFPASYPHRRPRNPRRHPGPPPDHVPSPSHPLPWCTIWIGKEATRAFQASPPLPWCTNVKIIASEHACSSYGWAVACLQMQDLFWRRSPDLAGDALVQCCPTRRYDVQDRSSGGMRTSHSGKQSKSTTVIWGMKSWWLPLASGEPFSRRWCRLLPIAS